jgi:hypothetical protein
MKPMDFQHVNYLWDDEVADQLDAVERCAIAVISLARSAHHQHWRRQHLI